jgi:hypothetical protein
LLRLLENLDQLTCAKRFLMRFSRVVRASAACLTYVSGTSSHASFKFAVFMLMTFLTELYHLLLSKRLHNEKLRRGLGVTQHLCW